ncbi:MAG: hypothetical protein KY476_22075 [Planctomycetes bacterium]|nr:hypothetical protein [Planctomycetota bacterium]
MLRTRCALVASCWTLAALAGCAHFSETRAISGFQGALAEEDLDALKRRSSSGFAATALRHDTALDDLKLLRLPQGKPKVTEVERKADDEKLVTVETGSSKQKVFYRLVKEPRAGWRIDDVYVRRRQEGLKQDKSVAEQMDLLAAAREFLDAWASDREAALAVVEPRLADVLAALPPVHFSRLVERVMGSDVREARPQSPGVTSGDVGIVRIGRPSGTMVLTMKRTGDRWVTADIAVESRDDQQHVPSVYKLALATRTAAAFLAAYRNGDKRALEPLTMPRFYEASLLPGDLASISLPSADDPDFDYQLEVKQNRADLIIPRGRDVVKVSLTHSGSEAAAGDELVADFRVEDVTLYESTPGAAPQEKRLSVLFTGRAMLRLFSDAAGGGDLAMLRKTSTADFNRRVWDRLDEAALADLSSLVPPGPPNILDAQFHGATTELFAEQAGQRVKYVLRDREGEVRIDDVLVEAPGLPASMKTVLELLLPVRSYARALAASRLDLLQRTSSEDMNRLVWSQTDGIPPAGYAAARHLRAALGSVEESGRDERLVVLGDARWGARVLLVRENDRFVVDDVLLIAGPEPAQQAQLKRQMRSELANGLGRAPLAHASGSLHASGGGQNAAGAIATVDYRDGMANPRESWPAQVNSQAPEPPRHRFSSSEARPLRAADHFGSGAEMVSPASAEPRGRPAVDTSPAGMVPSDGAFDEPARDDVPPAGIEIHPGLSPRSQANATGIEIVPRLPHGAQPVIPAGGTIDNYRPPTASPAGVGNASTTSSPSRRDAW